MALSKAQRAARRESVLGDLRPYVWQRERGRRVRVELTLQHGRRRPRVRGVVLYVAASGGFTLLGDDDWTDEVDLGTVARHSPTLHVPVDVIRSVRRAPDDRARARVRTSRR